MADAACRTPCVRPCSSFVFCQRDCLKHPEPACCGSRVLQPALGEWSMPQQQSSSGGFRTGPNRLHADGTGPPMLAGPGACLYASHGVTGTRFVLPTPPCLPAGNCKSRPKTAIPPFDYTAILCFPGIRPHHVRRHSPFRSVASQSQPRTCGLRLPFPRPSTCSLTCPTAVSVAGNVAFLRNNPRQGG
jgi:hypothetical protein